jgi:uncharacterized protein (TIGR02453 family)
MKSPFSNATYKFMKDLDANNNRGWFKANKGRYERDAREPMQEFIASMQKPLAKISKHIVADPSPVGGSMFRIYRDTRFGADKTPYKTHIACQFRHETGKDAHAPGFYFHIGLNENHTGGGIWHPDNQVLGKIRDRIVAKPDEWKKVIGGRKFKSLLGDVGGDSLKRPPKGYDPGHKYIEYIKMKDFWAGAELPRKVLTGDELYNHVIEIYGGAAPLMKFLCEALGLPF